MPCDSTTVFLLLLLRPHTLAPHSQPRCRKVRRVKDERGRRDWARENGMRWDSWDALASKKWVTMEGSGRVDDEGRPILERVDLMEAFFEGVHRQI